MIFSRPAGVAHHDLTPQNSTLFLEQAFAAYELHGGKLIPAHML